MLMAVVLTLISPTDAVLPGFLGRANYAATLKRLNLVDPDLVQRIHDGDGPKPLTCSSLLEARHTRQTRLEAGQPVHVRVTGLTPAVSAALSAALLDSPPKTWELDGHLFHVQETTCNPERHPWGGCSTYEALAEAQLSRQAPPDRQVTLEFASPTAFKSKGMTVPIPMPGLVFGSLVERWNSFSPMVLNPEMRRYGEEVMAISRYRLASRPVEHKNRSLRVGGLGQVTYVALAGDRYWLGVMHMLADFAFYSGVGAQTAIGMGQARRTR